MLITNWFKTTNISKVVYLLNTLHQRAIHRKQLHPAIYVAYKRLISNYLRRETPVQLSSGSTSIPSESRAWRFQHGDGRRHPRIITASRTFVTVIVIILSITVTAADDYYTSPIVLSCSRWTASNRPQSEACGAYRPTRARLNDANRSTALSTGARRRWRLPNRSPGHARSGGANRWAAVRDKRRHAVGSCCCCRGRRRWLFTLPPTSGSDEWTWRREVVGNDDVISGRKEEKINNKYVKLNNANNARVRAYCSASPMTRTEGVLRRHCNNEWTQ